MKKTIIAVVFVAALALTASAVFASFPGNNNSCCFPVRQSCCPEVTVNNGNTAFVNNNTEANANTGKNFTSSWMWGGSMVMTGPAMAGATSESYVNQNSTYIAPVQGKVTVNNGNTAFVNNNTEANANTGKNISGKGFTMTGGATAGASSASVVNTNYTVVGPMAPAN